MTTPDQLIAETEAGFITLRAMARARLLSEGVPPAHVDVLIARAKEQHDHQLERTRNVVRSIVQSGLAAQALIQSARQGKK